MKTSSDLFMSNLRNILWKRKMEKHPNNSNNISADSLEEIFKKKASLDNRSNSDDNVQTVVVPFYEKDVVIKVSKDMKRDVGKNKSKIRARKEQNVSNYLVNKNMHNKRSTYLERFRNQFVPNYVENKQKEPEISSMAAEVGDTDRGNLSFEDEEQDNPAQEFFDTEAYNEIYYENLLQREVANYSDDSSVECFNDDLENKSPNDNLRSVSEVSQPRQQHRRVTMEPNVDVKLGGLGPDVELMRPQLMRARSLQRYSDRVRAANRVSIYKKTVTENKPSYISEPKSGRKSAQNVPTRRVTEEKVSYLVNKSSEKTVKTVRKREVSDSAKPYKNEEQTTRSEQRKSTSKKVMEKLRYRNKTGQDENYEKKVKDSVEVRVKSNTGSKTIETKITPKNTKVPPIHISFLVNVQNNGSALKSLEEKHRRYQEMVKQYVNDYS